MSLFFVIIITIIKIYLNTKTHLHSSDCIATYTLKPSKVDIKLLVCV